MDIQLHNTLPFTSGFFFACMGALVLLFLLSKLFFSRLIPYRILLTLSGLTYIVLLFPKPLQLAGLILYLYFMVLLLRRFYKSENVVLPMVLLSLPMIYMKVINAQPVTEEDSKFLTESRKIIQIAGLSYMIFKVIGLYIDERRNTTKISFLDFFNFTVFIPTLLIGPLDRFQRFRQDLANGYQNMTMALYQQGWNNLVRGLLYKFILAEAIHRLIMGHLVDDGSLAYHAAYMYAYLFYLFFDFAGYSLLAISFGNFIGVHVPINFDAPFLAVNPKEFWKKWHKSLGDWLNDYFFKPIFKFLTTKQFSTSIRRQSIALFLTFTLMGFWNGFELHFIVSGMLFGLFSLGHNYYQHQCKVKGKDIVFGKMNPKLVRIISIFLMINSVAFAIYIFSGKLF
jgi:membrane protein involved in D-alanine export